MVTINEQPPYSNPPTLLPPLSPWANSSSPPDVSPKYLKINLVIGGSWPPGYSTLSCDMAKAQKVGISGGPDQAFGRNLGNV